jgi:hypothetical protein
MPQTKKKLTVTHLAKKISMEPDNTKPTVNVNIAHMLKPPPEQTVKTTKLTPAHFGYFTSSNFG